MNERPRNESGAGDGSPEPRSLAQRAIFALIRLAIALAIWAAIVLVIALAITPTKPETTPGPRSGHATSPVTESSFTDVEGCSGCHWDLFSQWSGAMHSLANRDPFYAGLYTLANEDTRGKAEEYCAASMCHSPAGFLIGESPFPHDKMSAIAQRGVFCDFCHTVAKRRGIGDGSYVVSPGPIKRGPYTNAESPSHQNAYSPLHTSSQFCGMCHNVSHPISGLRLETTYDEWARSPYAKGKRRRTCQDCHMKPYAGRAASLGIRRSAVFSHRFSGANTFIPASFEMTSTVRNAVRRLKSAARLGIASATRKGKKIRVAVRVTNVGAGHSLPTGITELRQMWVHLVVTSRGKTIYTSGNINDDGALDPQAHLFHTVLGDKNGQPVTKIWRAVRRLSDHRVPAGKSVIERYEFKTPPGGGDLRISAALMYREAPQEIVDLVAGDKKLKVTPVEMARTGATLR